MCIRDRPTLAAFIIGFLWPFIWGIYLSFCKFTTVQDVTFVGFSNYTKLMLDKTFSHSFWLTVVFAFVSSILINVLAFTIALALTKGFRGTNVFRTVFFMPNLIGGIVLGYIWQTLLNGLLEMCIRDSSYREFQFRLCCGEGFVLIDDETGAVYYTHLDVYKRQSTVGPAAWRNGKKSLIQN